MICNYLWSIFLFEDPILVQYGIKMIQDWINIKDNKEDQYVLYNIYCRNKYILILLNNDL